MILSLREAIYKKMEPKSAEDLFATIDDAIDNDERTLPGLGVLFEVLWKNSDRELRDRMVDTIKTHLPH
ncbi:small acid-soluble spore protein SspI [Paenibacillus sp.]|uniref:small acid-soluble spore protein SspI n=1 Tax=Paenibacillus sp. TaxID=58172 RepID=UPI002D70D10F|nr:small acid-soluble spore protein SspI [Paenibacillus sp.]HZG84541.1 small acid-soluble spore protein SspI [Paenibacillus sp.]